jgi:hypothetical protein
VLTVFKIHDLCENCLFELNLYINDSETLSLEECAEEQEAADAAGDFVNC